MPVPGVVRGGLPAKGAPGTQQDYDAQRLQTDQERARQQAAERGAVNARNAGVRGRTSYTDPTTGVSYQYENDAGPRWDAMPPTPEPTPQPEPPVDWRKLWEDTTTIGAPPPVPTPARVPHIKPEDEIEAQSLAFGRAKDRIGTIGRASLKGLHREMAARGVEGSGIEGNRTANLIASTGGQLGDVASTQAMETLRRLSDVTDKNYAGDLSQRGQDIDIAQAEAARRQQETQRRMSLFETLLRRNGGRIY
jgi:hypothetical protein